MRHELTDMRKANAKLLDSKRFISHQLKKNTGLHFHIQKEFIEKSDSDTCIQTNIIVLIVTEGTHECTLMKVIERELLTQRNSPK